MINKEIIRKSIRQLRNNLSKKEQHIASIKITYNTLNFMPIIKAKKIAIFFSVDGEVNTNQLITKLWKLNKQTYLPILNRDIPYHLLFLQYTPKTQLILNKYNIPEPIFNIKQLVKLNQLDVIILPLVAFDLKGNRLGMGKGFYDRTLQLNPIKKNFLLGLAYNFQLINNVPHNKLDVPLSAVITPSYTWLWNHYSINNDIHNEI